jgi:hypothetical protein
MDDNFFRQLDEKETEEFRQWARDNYQPGDEIKEVWHTVVREECARINEGQHEDPNVPEGYTRVDSDEGVYTVKHEPLQLVQAWCDCDREEEGLDWPCAIYMPDGACTCGCVKHHYHCSVCGKLEQVG